MTDANDIFMPEMDGVAATQAILAKYPEIKIIAMTSFDEADLVHDVLAAGAIGYLLKNITADELAKAIRNAASGKSTLSEAARVLIGSVSGGSVAAVFGSSGHSKGRWTIPPGVRMLPGRPGWLVANTASAGRASPREVNDSH